MSIKIFILAKFVENNKICPVVTEYDQIGSCCRRTAPVNPYIICEDNVRRGYCVEVLGGIFNSHSCQNNICSFRTGSCCSTSPDGNCISDISYQGCKKYFKDFVFDHKHGCRNNNSLCNPNEKHGTCILPTKKCENYITKKACENLRGSYDYIPCADRLDYNSVAKGSCCLRNGDCREEVDQYECVELFGKFTTDGKCSETCRYKFELNEIIQSEDENLCCMSEDEKECDRGICDP